ncbi:MAG TPA: 16S rRNA (cytosine(1402)-N(4))-methyltransferase RsmH [Rhodanobacteraceae bacterium]|nr:16S rRNA (cytosine(1402)-N(4))-methyltransferase RsmH [Rhodanobacteraceae bacterium]
MLDHKLQHIPVMLEEALEGLAVQPRGRYLDGTFGRGGHARALLQRLGPEGRLLVMDRDPAAIAAAQAELGADPRVRVCHDSFARLAEWDETAAGLDGVLLDLGVSSPQLDEAARGFSFMADAPLDMRMDPTAGASAADFLGHATEKEIADVLWRFGEERASRRVAHAIVARRNEHPIRRTGELAALLVELLGRREAGKHPATRTFQALRIHVNQELAALAAGLEAALTRLKPGARLVVISFHSLEDRVVKQFIRGHAGQPARQPRHLPPLPVPAASLRAVGKARFPGEAECAANPRARSAVLRVAERLDTLGEAA